MSFAFLHYLISELQYTVSLALIISISTRSLVLVHRDELLCEH